MNMDCAACGKPISVTAKFCGKCGAPVKRSGKPAEAEVPETAQGPLTPSTAVPEETPPTATDKVDDLVITLTPAPNQTLDDSGMLDIDLNLDVRPPPAAPVPQDNASQDFPAPSDADWLSRLEQQQAELKKTLEKHSLLLDFISLASQQQTHHQSQPNPAEHLLHEVVEKQTEFAVQLAQLQNHLNQQSTTASAVRIPEEWKLLLEKQKVEIQKAFTTNVTQITDNLGAAHAADVSQMQNMVKANAAAAEGLEKNLAPVSQGLAELKKHVQELSKKVESQGATARKAGIAGKVEDSDGGSLMIFVIGLLCGLTVVLSSLAIYNFLGHSSASSADSASHADTSSHGGDTSSHADSASSHADSSAKPKAKAHAPEGH